MSSSNDRHAQQDKHISMLDTKCHVGKTTQPTTITLSLSLRLRPTRTIYVSTSDRKLIACFLILTQIWIVFGLPINLGCDFQLNCVCVCVAMANLSLILFSKRPFHFVFMVEFFEPLFSTKMDFLCAFI